MATKKASGSDDKVHDVMEEFKEGTLKSSSGQKVTNRKQAIAIGLSEAREAGEDVSPERKSAASKKTAAKKAAPKKSAAKK